MKALSNEEQKVLESFQDDRIYYADKEYLSNSMIGSMLDNEDIFLAELRGEYVAPKNPNFGFGNYAHEQLMHRLVPGSINLDESPYIVVDDYDKRTKKGKDYEKMLIDTYGYDMHFIKKSDALSLDLAIDRIFENDGLVGYLQSCEFEYPMIGEYKGVKIKGKMDFVHKDKDGNIDNIIDFKTTSNLTSSGIMGNFTDSARKYGYARQAYMYSFLAGVDMRNFVFLALEKNNTNRYRWVTIQSEEFVNLGKEMFNNGIYLYKELMKGNMDPFLTSITL